ncbi:NADH-ubiquinone oxidoreductase chain 4L (mitochondrion) [[Candida] jaroonii]|uniref:NADH-ubiquinone oxidoreductase chain 4L n=1 Tax=[Candida] jaroonii TaxID=467808 RepID=A0ACA9YFY3_9ASCO|nr:NADH-ubiquinone oxidoreductase chain 4L [[Candida] jaroonii]
MMSMLTTMLSLYISKNNMMTLLIGMEMLLLTVTLKMMYVGGMYDDVQSTLYSLYMMMLAGAESAMGLSMLVSYYRLRGNVTNML